MALIKRLIIGPPMESNRLSHEKLPKWKALAVFSSDALSSVAYATEEILLVLLLLGSSALNYSLPISFLILALLMVVTMSYRLIIHSFPSGGGSYIVAREHIGVKTSLVAGAALMIDYVLTVSVSISSGVAALVSAFPGLIPVKVEIAVVLILVLMILNLRGISESATLFSYPTYAFVFFALALIIGGSIRLLSGGWVGFAGAGTAGPVDNHTSVLAFMFILSRAFSSGCSAMTGVEAISNGVPSFRPHQAKNAARTMLWMAGLLAVMFIGISFLSAGFGIPPAENRTVISQLGEAVFGNGAVFYTFQIVTMLILFLAANTSFAGFPQLVSIIARDGFLPRKLAARGDRLVFSNGIILLSLLAILLVIIFDGQTHSLIPLYAVGVFMSFTITQYGLVRKLWNEENRPYPRIFTIGSGGVVTGIVTIVTAVAKFTSGAWVVLVAIPLLIGVFMRIREHYSQLSKQLKLEKSGNYLIQKTKVVLPISGVSKVVDQSVAYARTISSDITAVSVVFDERDGIRIREKWMKWYPEIPLEVIYSPYRTILNPILAYLSKLEESTGEGQFITVLMPQFVTKKWWHAVLHNQSAAFLRFYLILKKDIAVSTIPYHIKK